MVFSSVTFLLYFFPLFFFLYFLVGKGYKNAVILAGSIFFYSWGAPRFIFVILGTTLVDFFVVRQMYEAESPRLRKLLLVLSVCINIGLLFYFKYSGFFIDNVNQVFSLMGLKPMAWTKLALPIGISFYTFETITYVVDIYRGIHPPLRRFRDYLLYIIFFPKLIAGPIIRFHEFASQIEGHVANESYENRLRGIYRFCIGLAKKALIANAMGAVADEIFSIDYLKMDTVTAWAGALSYTFQIYFDFSGYSDMAIGLGMMMGFRIPENFNNPYTAVSITDFWRRWHITLGAWMRNYLYIPLGGNRVQGKWRLYFNLWIVFLASGLWHGASRGFIIWGAYHGFFLVLERIFLERWLKKIGAAAVLYTFPVVLLGWVVFRVEHLTPALHYFSRMFSWQPPNCRWFPDGTFAGMACIAAFFSFITITAWGRRLQQQVFYEPFTLKRHFVFTATVILLLVLSVGKITTGNFNPFIYFRF